MRYHAYKDGASGPKKILALVYLLWLNFGYYVLRIRRYGEIDAGGQGGEILITEENGKSSVEDCVTKLSAYDVISFDIFDTLIFRPFDEPTELFDVLGQELGIPDFRRLRTNAEYQARVKKKKSGKYMEVSLTEIWQELEAEAGAAAGNPSAAESAKENSEAVAAAVSDGATEANNGTEVETTGTDIGRTGGRSPKTGAAASEKENSEAVAAAETIDTDVGRTGANSPEAAAEAGAAAACDEMDFAAYGAQAEMNLEEKLCFADPFMLNVWRRLKEQGKEIIVISDMYLPGAFLEKLLEKNGFTGFARLYVSNEWGRTKSDGSLFRLVRRQLETDGLAQGATTSAETMTTSPAQEDTSDSKQNARAYNELGCDDSTQKNELTAETVMDSPTQESESRNKLRVIHIGDNVISDWQMARKNGFESRLYRKRIAEA